MDQRWNVLEDNYQTNYTKNEVNQGPRHSNPWHKEKYTKT